MKIVKWVLLSLVGIVVLGVVLLYLNIDHIVKSTVESQGTEQLKVPTTLDGVSLGLFKGTVDLNQLNIGSPPGFNAPHMLSLGGLSVDTGGISNLRKDPIHISTIKIDQPTLVVEFSKDGVNFKKLMDNLPSNPDQNPPAGEKKPTRLIIDDLAINNAQVVLRGLDQANQIPGLKANLPAELPLTIPSFSVKNIGNADGAQNGAAIKDVATTVITQLVAKAADSDKIPPEVKALLSGNLDAVKDKLTQMGMAELNKETDKLKAKLPGNIGGLLNGVTGGNPPAGGQPANGNGSQDLLNQGFNALRGATSKPAK